MLSCTVYVLGYVDTDPIILFLLYHGRLSVTNLSSHGRGCRFTIRVDRGTEGDPGGLPHVPEYSEQVDTSEFNRTSRCNTPFEDQHRGEAERGYFTKVRPCSEAGSAVVYINFHF